MMIETMLFISVILNVVFILYCRWLINNYRALTQDIQTIQEMISAFIEHLTGIYELEMFYGDQTLSSLMQHGKELREALGDIDLLEEYDNTEEATAQETQETEK